MENKIKTTYNYSDLSVDTLLNLLKNLKIASVDKKKEVLNALINKYFANKSSFNLYKLLEFEKINFLSRTEILSLKIGVLHREFATSNNEIPKDFRVSFFEFLISSMNYIEQEIHANNGTIEWTLLDIPKLVDYLLDAKNLNIPSPSLRQKINDLTLRIKEEWNKKIENDKKSQAIIKTDLDNKINKIETLKLQKSKLNKTSFSDALSSFKLYEPKDQEYLINFMIKHSWTDMIKNINSIDAFDYFRNNYHENPEFSMWVLLYKGLSKAPYKNKEENIDAWKKYFNVDSIASLIDVLKELYLSYNGSTELGFNVYIKDIIKNIFGRNIILECSDELTDYLRLMEIENMYFDFEQFKEFRFQSIVDFCTARSFKVGYVLESPPIIDKNSGVMCENIKNTELFQSPVNYYWTVYKKYNNLLFNYYGCTTKQKELSYAFNDKTFIQSVNDFIYLIDTIQFDGDYLVNIHNNKLLVPYDDGLRSFIRRYFSQNDELMSNETLKSFCFKEENRKVFFEYVSHITYSGSYPKPDEYAEYFFERLYEELDFKNKEDIKLFLDLKINYPTGKTISLFYQKLQKECIDFYLMIDDYLQGDLKDSYPGIKNMLSVFYGF